MSNTTYQCDPVHMDPNGSFWFYAMPAKLGDQPTGRYGPYLDEATARGKLNEYIGWVNSQKPRSEPTEADNAVIEYLQIRDDKAALVERHKKELAELEERQAKADAWFLAFFQNNGIGSFKAGGCTVYTEDVMQASIGDKEAFMEHVRRTGQVELLQSRVSSTTLKQFMADNNEQLPPGVKVNYDRAVRVRRT